MARSADVTRPDLRADRRGPRRQMSLMHAFRATVAERSSKTPPADRPADGQDVRERRAHRGDVDTAELHRHLALDLDALMSTIRLGAVQSLDDDSHLARSVLNYGFPDFSRVGVTTIGRTEIGRAIRNSLLAFEPRIIERSLEVTMAEDTSEDEQRLTFHIQAEVIGDPVNLPLDFVAEVDMGAGKLQTRRLKSRT